MKIRLLLIPVILLSANIQYISAEDPIKYIDDYPGLICEANGWNHDRYDEVTGGYDIYPANGYDPIGEIRIPGLLKEYKELQNVTRYFHIDWVRNFNKLTGITSVIFECNGPAPEGLYGPKYASAGAGSKAFHGMPNLESVNLGGGDHPRSIESEAFSDCPKLQIITSEGGKVSVGSRAFANCPNLKTFGNNNANTELEIHGDSAFINDSSLEYVFGTVNFRNNDYTTKATCVFMNCVSLKSIDISSFEIPESSFENCYSLESVNMGNPNIHKKAFFNCTGLKTITLQSPNVANVGDSAFYNCIRLPYLDMMEHLETIGNASFYNCATFDKISVPMAKNIGICAFYGCKNVKEITLAKDLQSIGSRAFASCNTVTDVYCYALWPPTTNDDFFSTYTATLHVPYLMADAYRNAPGWRNFKNIVEDMPWSEIEEIEQGDINVHSADGRIIVSGNDDNEAVAVYRLDGKMVYSGHDTEIAVPAGLYIVKIGGYARKVSVK